MVINIIRTDINLLEIMIINNRDYLFDLFLFEVIRIS